MSRPQVRSFPNSNNWLKGEKDHDPSNFPPSLWFLKTFAEVLVVPALVFSSVILRTDETGGPALGGCRQQVTLLLLPGSFSLQVVYLILLSGARQFVCSLKRVLFCVLLLRTQLNGVGQTDMKLKGVDYSGSARPETATMENGVILGQCRITYKYHSVLSFHGSSVLLLVSDFLTETFSLDMCGPDGPSCITVPDYPEILVGKDLRR